MSGKVTRMDIDRAFRVDDKTGEAVPRRTRPRFKK
jgi:hypothetical protein